MSNNTNGNRKHRKKTRNKKFESKNLASVRSVSTNTNNHTSETPSIRTEKKESGCFTKSNSSNKKNRFNKPARNRNFSSQRSGNPKKENESRGEISVPELNKAEFKKKFLKTEFGKYATKPTKPQRNGKSQLSKMKQEDLPYRSVALESNVCPICNKNITNMMTALFDETNNQYAHFDCMYDKLKNKVSLEENERLSYIGNGTFAVIEDYRDSHSMKFKIKQKYQIVTARSIK